MSAYYNELDPKAAAWLRELIRRNLIAPGDVDERSITDVQPADLRGYAQCHFFAGIGVWSYALRRAGWDDARPAWTGSCPCQPFSAAGKGAAYADERHLWPHWHRLIRECRPAVVFGEQVAAAVGSGWLDDVCLSLEALGYAVGALDFPAASVGAPHIRQRLYFCGATRAVADADAAGRGGERRELLAHGHAPSRRDADRCGLMGDAERAELPEQRGEPGASRQARSGDPRQAAVGAGAPTNGFWRDAEWLLCRDGKARPVEPGTFPLAHGTPARVVRLRGYGNAIVAPAAAAFVSAYMDATA